MPCSWQKTNRSGDRSQRRDVMADSYAPDDDDELMVMSFLPTWLSSQGHTVTCQHRQSPLFLDKP